MAKGKARLRQVWELYLFCLLIFLLKFMKMAFGRKSKNDISFK